MIIFELIIKWRNVIKSGGGIVFLEGNWGAIVRRRMDVGVLS